MSGIRVERAIRPDAGAIVEQQWLMQKRFGSFPVGHRWAKER